MRLRGGAFLQGLDAGQVYAIQIAHVDRLVVRVEFEKFLPSPQL
jgi:hypothetical protein